MLVGSKVVRSVGVDELPGKDLAGAAGAALGKGPCRGNLYCPCNLCGLGPLLFCFACPCGLGFSPASLPCLAHVRPWQAALTARAQVKGSKAMPLLLYTDNY